MGATEKYSFPIAHLPLSKSAHLHSDGLMARWIEWRDLNMCACIAFSAFLMFCIRQYSRFYGFGNHGFDFVHLAFLVLLECEVELCV